MPAARRLTLLAALACATGVALAGCASSSIQTDATAFLDEHGSAAVRITEANRSVEAAASRLTTPTSSSKRSLVSRAAEKARRGDVQAGEWDLASSGEGGEEGFEEEDLPRSETEATAAANELGRAMSALEGYLRNRSADALARYHSELGRGREQWDESITQLWHLAHRSNPPTL